jgi:hypothetical protein
MVEQPWAAAAAAARRLVRAIPEDALMLSVSAAWDGSVSGRVVGRDGLVPA